MKNKLADKLTQLQNYLDQTETTGVLFSGGTDSSLLLYLVSLKNNDNLTALTLNSKFFPTWEYRNTQEFTEQFSIRHQVIEFTPLEESEIVQNSSQRCYYCKAKGFGLLKNFAQEHSISRIFDGSCIDDLGDHRPGLQALKELEIISPFIDFKITKNDINELMNHFELQEWIRPSCACLASRIPYGDEITAEVLQRINTAEEYLHSLNLPEARVRMHKNLARIEVYPENLTKAFENREAIVEYLKTISINYISLDLQGYRSGSLNETIQQNDIP